MSLSLKDIRTLNELRAYVHGRLCEKENLLGDQFTMTESRLIRRTSVCGLQFSLIGPRNVRLGAVWAACHNAVYLYDAQGVRYEKLRLKHRLNLPPAGESTPADSAAA